MKGCEIMMLKFVQLPSLEKMCSIIENSRGKVYLQQSEEIFVDLKQSSNVITELRDTLKQGCNITLHVFDQKDYLDFVNFMVGTAYDESASIQSI